MKYLLPFLLVLGACELPLKLTRDDLIGTWHDEDFPSDIYTFDSNYVRYDWINDLGSFHLIGHYTITNDSIFIDYSLDTIRSGLARNHPSYDTLLVIRKDKLFMGSHYDPSILYIGSYVWKN